MKRRSIVSLLKGVFLVQVFVIIVLIGVAGSLQQISLPTIKPVLIKYLYPFSRIEIGEDMALKMFQDSSFLPGEADLLFLDPEYLDEVFPQSLLTASIQALAYTSAGQGDEPVIVLEEEVTGQDIDLASEQNQPETKARPSQGKILLYCTHSGESYISDEGKARVDGKRGLINQVARHLSTELNQKGLDSEFVSTIHDYPDYLMSYTNSRNTIKSYLAGNKSVAAVFDIHRDSIPGAKSAETVMINGKRCAPILIIVGTSERKPHPNWKENLAFAQAIYEAGEARYPGLIKGVRTKAGTYNQEFHKNALLLEIGYDHNTLAEAKYAATLFAEVLAEVMQGEGI
ncbi:MAG: stage II sporulation protein P [Syntrophomonadaceae bacterium]|nr:stage II sporulation protein P [Syntrophomonadaceae bacterium]